MIAQTLTNDQLQFAANTVKILSADAVEKAHSGHPGMPMGMAELGVALWLKFLRFNPQDPKWIGRDRFVLSNGHGSMFLYSLLHLSGYALSLDEIKKFRQLGSITPGHPENYMTPGVETTTGPLGQGISNAVGMALAQSMMSERYRADGAGAEGFDPFAQRIFCFCGDGCLMEGVSSEASSLAGHLGLGSLKVVYDDNEISIAGSTDLAFTENVAKRYEAYGWYVQDIDGHDWEQIDQAYRNAIKETTKPSLIIAHTIIGRGSPKKAGTSEVHGEALGKDELLATKKNLNWPTEEMFFIPEDVRKIFASRAEELKRDYAVWQEKFKAWSAAQPQKAQLLEKQLQLQVPADFEDKLAAAVPSDGKPQATRNLGGAVLQVASANCPALIGGSADLEPSTKTLIKNSSDIKRQSFSGLNLRFGVREHGMGALMNGLAYYGGFIPYGSTFFCFLDYMRPPVRLAAVSHLPGLFIFTHDSVFLGEDGPTHQAVEHLAMLRATPRIWTMRPADGVETAVCFAQAIERHDGPSAIMLSRQNIEPIERPASFKRSEIRRGGYTVYESGANPEIVFVATGSEVPLAIAAAKQIKDKVCRVVSMPCVEIYLAQEAAYRQTLIPTAAKKVVVEAGSSFGWLGVVGGAASDAIFVTVDRFGFSAPAAAIAVELGFTPEAIVQRVKAWK